MEKAAGIYVRDVGKMKESLYAIGEMAKISNVSIQTLRYYDQIGLFKPAFVDPTTNYRYYKDSQLYHLDIIKSFKYIGTSLEDIKNVQLQQADDVLRFLNKQELQVEKQLERLTQIKQTIAQVKNQMKKFYSNATLGQVLIREEEDMWILQSTARNITPIDILNSSYSELKKVIEADSGIMNNGYGAIFPYEPYENIEQIAYSHIYTPILFDKQLASMTSETEISKIEAGTYVCIVDTYSSGNYFANYSKIVDTIQTQSFKVIGSVYELFMPIHYSLNKREDYLIEIRVRVN